MSNDPRTMLADARMSAFQIVAVAITIGLNALDGFDVLSISFALPSIVKEWGLDPAAKGLVLSMELIGMAIGSIFLGRLADQFGRRPTILACLVVMTIGMFMVAISKSIINLSAWRFITGLGIGGMLAAINATVAEYANAKNRDMCVSLMAVGYPVGAVLGGKVASLLLQQQDWRAVFIFGGCVTALMIPLVWWRLPETIAFLCTKQPADGLTRINHTLERMGHPPINELPERTVEQQHGSAADLFLPGLIGVTTLITLAYFLHIATFYFMIKWIPTIVADMGFSPSSAADVLVWANIGGATGGATLGILTQRYNVKLLTASALFISFIMVWWFGHGQQDLKQLALISAIAGFFTNAGVVGLYALFAQAFPTHLRAFGTGFAIGMGRGGAALAPIIAGLLFKAGYGLQTVATLMGLGALLASVAVLSLKFNKSTH